MVRPLPILFRPGDTVELCTLDPPIRACVTTIKDGRMRVAYTSADGCLCATWYTPTALRQVSVQALFGRLEGNVPDQGLNSMPRRADDKI